MIKDTAIGFVRKKLGFDSTRITARDIKLQESWALNPITRSALLTIFAGYDQTDYLQVADRFPRGFNRTKFARFLTYTLNHPHFSPRRYSLHLNQYQKAAPVTPLPTGLLKPNTVSVFSGGLDSTAGLLFALDQGLSPLPLWVMFGQRNEQAEHRSVRKVASKLRLELLSIHMNLAPSILRGWGTWGYIVPGRNFLFVALAASLFRADHRGRKTIYLCAHKDEMSFRRNRDKSQHFFDQASRFLTDGLNVPVKVTTPFGRVDKTRVLAYWRLHWLSRYHISPHDTTTCYYEKGCGRCEACLKRTVQLLAAGFREDPWMSMHPFRGAARIIRDAWIPRIRERRFSLVRLYDLILASRQSSVKLPVDLMTFVQQETRRRKHSLYLRAHELHTKSSFLTSVS